MQTSRHHICATQVFEAFDTFEDIGEISSKRCLGTFLRLLRIWRCGAPLLSLGTPAPCEAGCALHTCSTVPTPCQEDHTLRQGVRESVSSRGFSAGLRAGGGWAGSRQGGEGRGEVAWLSWWVSPRHTGQTQIDHSDRPCPWYAHRMATSALARASTLCVRGPYDTMSAMAGAMQFSRG